MNVILLTNLDKVGSKYDVVAVKPGYGRNFLIPKRMAIVANKTNLAKLDDYKRSEADKQAQLVSEMTALKDRIEAKALTIGAKAGTSGKIFGSVTSVQVIQALKEQMTIELDRKLVEMPEEIKTLGSYKAVANLHKEVKATISLDVVAD